MDFAIAAALLVGLVLAHEAGHFYAALLHGVPPKAFSLGFGPTLWRMERGGTRYQVGMFPLGGFVQFEPGDLESRPVATRLAVAGGGVAAQIVLALLLMGAVYGAWGVPAGSAVTVTGVAPAGPAARAGVRAGERVLAIDGVPASGFAAVLPLLARADRADRPVRLLLALPSGGVRRAVVPPEGHRMGIDLAAAAAWARNSSFVRREEAAAGAVAAFLQAEARGLWALATGRASLGQVAGPIGLVRATSQAVVLGIPETLSWTALLSANLALVNVLPVPGLDGGQVALLLLERLRGRRLGAALEAAVQGAGLALVLLFALVVTMHDVAVLIGG
ncbi:MAG: M50 family metallopeptidase [Firmicutes bacterium]|nr:M50 family metallopeptidase [Bacillota bacterium]